MVTRRGGRAGSGLRAEGIRFLRRRPRVVGALLGWSVLEAVETFLTGFALARALDDGFLAGRAGVGLGWLGLAALAVAAGAFGTGRVYRAVAALVEPLRDGLVRRVVARGLDDAVRDPHGADTAVVSRLTQQVEIARDTFAGLVMVSRSFLFTVAGALIGLLSLAPVLLLVVVPPLFVGLGLFCLTLRPMNRRQAAFLTANEDVAESLGAMAAGLRDIAACGAEERMTAEAARRIDTEFRASRVLARWGVLRALALGVGGRLPVVLLLASAPWLLGRGVTAGALVGALAYLTQSLLPALQSLTQGLGTAGSRFVVVLGRLVPQAAAPDPADAAPAGDAPYGPALRDVPAAPAVELRGVTFAYGELAEPVVRELDLVVPRGCHLAVVGPSGIGKSTLAGLIGGLLHPGAGVVELGGRPLRERPATELPGMRVLIPQEAYVFAGSVRDNLSYLCPGPEPVSDSRLRAAAGAVGMAELLDRMGGLDGIAEPGTLSQGERQLLALTRAYLSPAPLVLLDEATCHLDPAAEARAERAFALRPGGGALIVIAHRISSARRADRVLVMDGTHTVCGGHEELLERSALYRDLVGNWSEPAGHPGYSYGVDPVPGARLAGDRGHVVAHGAVAQVQDAGDLTDGRTFGGE
ncbi:ABC transporter ATP-binding protein/permease [Streptomyces sp. RKAG293]|nr:ABC transporter ATP-binding protein/permease [Streptomyces sp. RKAG293]